VWTHATGPGQATALANLSAIVAEKIPGAGDVLSSPGHSDNDYAMIQGIGWTLDVRGDGNWARYWSDGHGGSQVPVEDRMSTAELERLARKFIAETLSAQIVLSPAERLEVWRTSFELSGGGPPNGQVDRKVVSNRIVFTRVIGETVVVGPGSKISVTFNNSRQIVGFQYDWSPLLASGETQRAAPPELVKSRLSEILAQKREPRATVASEKIECGYYDVGALAGSTGELQAGCVAQHSLQSGGLKHSIVTVVPATQDVSRRADWPETSLISK